MSTNLDQIQPQVQTQAEARTAYAMSPELDDYISLTFWYRKLGNHLRYENPKPNVANPGVDTWIATGNPTAVDIFNRARLLLSIRNTMTPEEKSAALVALEKEADELIASTPPIINSYLSTKTV